MIDTQKNRDELYKRMFIPIQDIQQIANVGRAVSGLPEVGADTQIEVLSIEGEYSLGHFVMIDDWWAFVPFDSREGDKSSVE